MKLVLAIVHDEYVSKVTKSLTDNDFRITKLASTGGFLKSGNTTLLMGVEEDRIEKVIEVIKSKCEDVKFGKHPKEEQEVEVGGATLFIMDMNQFNKM